MLKLWKATLSHEDLFIERYQRLLAWSLKLTGHDRQLAEDLLHDVFVQFTLSRPNLSVINDLDAYLFAALRNSHLSYVRRAPHVRTAALSMAEYDSIQIGLRATDLRDQIKIQDELRLICFYASARKETSKAGSVLILRFFHGYYPSEIARVLGTNLEAVRKWLQLARNEARLYLVNPDTLSFIRDQSDLAKPQLGFASATEKLLNDLRNIIFASRRGDCLSHKQLRELYRSPRSPAIDGSILAHIVSCRACLDGANTVLDLPQLKDRYPTDMTGKDDKNGPGGPTSVAGGGSTQSGVRRSLGRVKETFEHYPKELRIVVNGYLQVSQKVSSDLMEQTLSLDLEEKIGFVEIFSEQWVRLFFLNVEHPPDGAFEQEASVVLSEGRNLKATLDFSGPCPNLQVTYHDPTAIADSKTEAVNTETSPLATLPLHEEQWPTSNIGSLKTYGARPWRAFSNVGFWLRPATVTALVAVILAAFFVFVNLHRTPTMPTSAAGLLAQSVASEQMIAARTDQVLHRTINLEERRSASASATAGDQTVITRRRIEIWQSAEKGITARRLFDEKGYLVSGEWRRSDGSRILYSHGSKPQIGVQSTDKISAPLDLERVWWLDPSAASFMELIGLSEPSRVVEKPTDYVIEYQRSEANEGLFKATLVLSKVDLHATELTLIAQQQPFTRDEQNVNRQWTEFRFVETSFERRALSAVAPSVFEPDPELLSSRTKDEAESMKGAESNSSYTGITSSPATVTSELEVEVLDLLSRVGADLDEQTSVTRTADGKLRVRGLVETEKRKEEILRTLVPVTANRALQIQIETVAEATKRQGRSSAESEPVTVEQVEVERRPIAAFSEIRRHVGSDEEVGRYAARMVNRSSEAMSHAAVLRRLLRQFSPDDLRALTPEARAKWLGMIRAHARAFQREAMALDQELQTIFPPVGQGSTPGPISSDGDLANAVERLYALGAATDQAIRSAFTTSTGGAGSSIKTAQFWQSLTSAEALAVQIQAVR